MENEGKGWGAGRRGAKTSFRLVESVKMRMRRGRYENISKSFKYTIFSY